MDEETPEQLKARRTILLLYVIMGVMIAVPVVIYLLLPGKLTVK
jgi:hypothetical protein